MATLNKIIYLDSAEQFVELYQNGTVTKVNGTVVTYNEDDLYLIAKKPIVIDSVLSATSENPVQNKVIYQAIGNVQRKLYRHTVLLRDTTQDLTLRFILENDKSVGYAPSTPMIPSAATAETLFGTLFEDIENTTDGTFRQMSGLPYGTGMVTTNMSNFLGFDIAFFSGNVSSATVLHMNVFDPNGASEIVLEVSDVVEEL